MEQNEDKVSRIKKINNELNWWFHNSLAYLQQGNNKSHDMF